MLSIRPYQRCTNPAVNKRMKPPRQIRSTLCWSSAACSTASNAARSLPNGLLSIDTVGTPLALAFSIPPASGWLEITTTISAGKPFAAAAPINAAMFDPRPEIRIATRRFMASPSEIVSRCQIEMTVIDHAMFIGGRYHFAQQRNGLAALVEYFGDLLDGVWFHDGDHADAAVEGAQQFEFGDAPLLRQPLEDRQHRQPGEIDADAEVLWQHARNIVGETAAGDVSKTLDRTGLANRAQTRSHIEPRRRQQRAAQRHDRRKRRRRFESEPGHFDNLADQGKPVGVNPRRGEADHRVTGGDVGPRQQRAAFGGADRKSGEIIIAVLVEAGHLRGFATDQRATGFPATLGNARDDAGRGFGIELAAGEIIQKEQRLRTLDHEVVDRHRHQIDADAAVQAGLDGDLDLGANAVGRGDQNRVLEPGRLEVEQTAESADFGVGAGAGGGTNHR